MYIYIYIYIPWQTSPLNQTNARCQTAAGFFSLQVDGATPAPGSQPAAFVHVAPRRRQGRQRRSAPFADFPGNYTLNNYSRLRATPQAATAAKDKYLICAPPVTPKTPLGRKGPGFRASPPHRSATGDVKTQRAANRACLNCGSATLA